MSVSEAKIMSTGVLYKLPERGLILIPDYTNILLNSENFFVSGKADGAGGLAPGNEDNADRRKTNRKDSMILIGD
ncbi:MAG: hypothetical protein PHR18_03260 [Oscillospiraceae bacterium]|nr:hypothetical protein [Oscillospiraceae bacterium]